MSFCRWGQDESDVYVYAHVNGCYRCECGDGHDAATAEDMIEHLTEHRGKGDNVPEYAIAALKREARQ